MINSRTPAIGDEFEVIIGARLSPDQWVVHVPGSDSEWEYVLRARHTNDLQSGEQVPAWVFAVDGLHKRVLVSNSDFGRLPISDRMRPRYLHSLKAVLALVDGEAPADSSVAADVSEVKGMFNRCYRRDQWDWLAVYEALGRPERPGLSRFVQQLDSLARSLRANDAAAVDNALTTLRHSGIKNNLQSAIAAVSESFPVLPDAQDFSNETGNLREHRSVYVDPLAEKSGRTRRSMPDDSRSKLAVATSEHAKTLRLLKEHLENLGYQVAESEYIDAYSRLKSGPAIFEVKSINADNELEQVRHAVSQLYEYRYRHGVADASLWLVLSRPPTLAWLPLYLEDDRDIHVLWVDAGELTGPSFELLHRNPRTRDNIT